MKPARGYRKAVLILSIVVALQWVFIFFLVGRPKKIVTQAPRKPVQEFRGTIAIVLDDWGYNVHNLPVLEQIHVPLTLSILPNLPYSGKVALEAEKRGFEVILHLPMEPYEKFRLEQGTILTSMDAQHIRAIVKRDLDAIHYAKGASNHMGSKATGDLRVMGIVFEELKKRNLYFLDSLVSPKTVSDAAAQRAGVRFVRRDVFLDNKEDPMYIRGQAYKLKAKASLYGQAVGIGHDRSVTLKTLKEIIPELEKEGYRFVFVSQLVH